jgi:hypothetical protein
MKSGQSIELQLVDENCQPLQLGNVMIDIHLFLGGDLRYRFIAGRTTKEGKLSISYEDLDHTRKDMGEMYLMDFNSPLDDCDPLVRVLIYSERELIERRDKAMNAHHKTPAWAEVWPSNSKLRAEPVSIEILGQVTHVQMPCRLLGAGGTR